MIPSLPGYGFSERPRPHHHARHRAAVARLMRSLGYERYGAQGGDFGAGVTTYMALDDPAPLLGIHLHQSTTARTRAGGSPLYRRRAGVRRRRSPHWDAIERGYSSIQSTKPQTVGYALNDSPAGLAAWILEKWRSWTDAARRTSTATSCSRC